MEKARSQVSMSVFAKECLLPLRLLRFSVFVFYQRTQESSFPFPPVNAFSGGQDVECFRTGRPYLVKF